MKFDVEKFMKDTNDSDYFRFWNDNLKQMNEILGLPTFSNSKHYWTFFLSDNMRRSVHIGFDEKGNLFCEYSGRRYKDENKAVMTEEQTNSMAEKFLQVLNVFDEFGFIIRTPQNEEVRE